MKKVTGLTITDEQIRWLQRRTGWKGRAAEDQSVIATALSTSKWFGYDAQKREAARAKCAEWYNAQQASIPDIFADLIPAKPKKAKRSKTK